MIPLKIMAVFRATNILLHLAYGLAIASLFPWLSKAARRRTLQRWSARLLCILNVKIITHDSMRTIKSGMIVTNHISWLDIFVLNAMVPMRFVAKSEVRQWLLIGWLCARAQTLFIERGHARDAARINKQVVQLLQDGEHFAVFPEGTTTDGTHVGTFHSSLLQSAVDAGAQIHPVTLRYQNDQGEHSTAAAYIDDVSFGSSLWNILLCRSLHVMLVATPSIDAAGSDRRTLTRTAWQQISAALMHAHNSPMIKPDESYQRQLLCPLPPTATDRTV